MRGGGGGGGGIPKCLEHTAQHPNEIHIPHIEIHVILI